MSRRISYLVAAASLVGLLQQDSYAQWRHWRDPGNMSGISAAPEAESGAVPNNGLAAEPNGGLNVEQRDIDKAVEKLSLDSNINVHGIAGNQIDLHMILSYSMKGSNKEKVAERIGSNHNDPLLKDILEASASMAFDGNPELSDYLSSREIKRFEEGRLFLGKKMLASLDKMMYPLGLRADDLKIGSVKAEPAIKPYDPNLVEANSGSPENQGYSTLYNSLKTKVRVLTTAGKPVDVEYIVVYSFPADKKSHPDSNYNMDSSPDSVNSALIVMLRDKTFELFALDSNLDTYAHDGKKRTSGGRKFIADHVMPDFYKKAGDSGIMVNELIVTNLALVAPEPVKKSPGHKEEHVIPPEDYMLKLSSNNPFR